MPAKPPSHNPRPSATRGGAADRRPSAHRRGYGVRWQKYRAAYLQRHPFCVACERAGRLTAANEVDHIRAVKGPLDPAFWPETNHQGLCGLHHRQKTAAERDGKAGRPIG